MRRFTLDIVIIFSIVWLVCCNPHREKNDTVNSYTKRTREAIATDDLIQKYEREHQKFYSEEIGDGDHLKWHALESIILNDYCRKYLQHSVPTKMTDDATAAQFNGILNYEKENTNRIGHIVIINCRVAKRRPLYYYMTKALEPNCVYALRCRRDSPKYKFSIINKYCDFEDKPLIRCFLKRKRIEVIDKIHRRTGQPIAKNEYLLQYELEHQELLIKEGKKGERIEWPYAMENDNLNSYCYQYMRECVPTRKQEDVSGSWNTEKLIYQKLNTNGDIYVTVVKCHSPSAFIRYYYMTRASETNCVYALDRHSCGNPFVIIFKHCDFEDPRENMMILDKNVVESKVKDEMINSWEALQFFPKD